MTESLVSGSANPVKFVRAHAGKGAVLNYGRRTRSGANKALRAATGLGQAHDEHSAPKKPLPELRTFSQPSSSVNSLSWLKSGGAQQGASDPGRPMPRKRTALILPGQGSQYVTMSRDLYDLFPAARHVWHEAEETLTAFMQGQPLTKHDMALASPLRSAFEEKLLQGATLETTHAPKPGWLLDLVFAGDQLELTRSENAQPAILACTLALLAVLRHDFGVDLVKEHIHWSAGHGSGAYAALVASGSLLQVDALRALRYRGLEAMKCLENHPVLFPEGSKRPASIYETWGFANAGSGKGSDLIVETLPSEPSPDEDGSTRKWKGTQVSAVVVRPGRLQDALREVDTVQHEIHNGLVPGIARDEFVAVANVNSQLQMVVAGTRVGVSYACDRLRFKLLGARAANLPVSGPYHTSMVKSATDAFRGVVDVMPIHDPSPDLAVVSSLDGHVYQDSVDIRTDLGNALDAPVHWVQSINTLVEQGVRRFVCLGPGRACAHQLSKELAYYEKSLGSDMNDKSSNSEFEVWSVSTTQGMEQLASALRRVPPAP